MGLFSEMGKYPIVKLLPTKFYGVRSLRNGPGSTVPFGSTRAAFAHWSAVLFGGGRTVDAMRVNSRADPSETIRIGLEDSTVLIANYFLDDGWIADAGELRTEPASYAFQVAAEGADRLVRYLLGLRQRDERSLATVVGDLLFAMLLVEHLPFAVSGVRRRAATVNIGDIGLHRLGQPELAGADRHRNARFLQPRHPLMRNAKDALQFLAGYPLWVNKVLHSSHFTQKFRLGHRKTAN
ncbi:MAG: hypothetical protein EOO77_03690 [Oxalobacteraceae bacterium]|nr:MAG: hypothetical protein EOO77_03690 [Oxalobacteraceae bacterium]